MVYGLFEGKINGSLCMKKYALLNLLLVMLLVLGLSISFAQDDDSESDSEQQTSSLDADADEQVEENNNEPELFQVNSETVINARSAPSTTASVAGVLQPGGIVEVIDSVEGSLVGGNSIWYSINLAGNDVYVHSSLLVPTSSLPNQNVILDLPTIFLPTIVVDAVGKTYVEPDLAIIQVGFEYIGTNSASVYTTTQNAQEAVVNALMESGIQSNDITHSLTTISNEDVVDSDGGITGEFVFRGQATLTVYVKDLQSVQSVVETALSTGANRIDNMVYTLSDFTEAENQARRNGLERALELATDTAIQSQIVLGPAVTTTLGAFEVSSTRDFSEPTEIDLLSQTPLQPAQLVVSVNITVEYGILVR